MNLTVWMYLNVITLTALYKQIWKNYYMVGKVLPWYSIATWLTSLSNYRLKGFAGHSNSIILLKMRNVVVVKLILKTGGL